MNLLVASMVGRLFASVVDKNYKVSATQLEGPIMGGGPLKYVDGATERSQPVTFRLVGQI